VFKVIHVDQFDEPVKRFLESLDADPEGSVVDLVNRRVYLVVRPSNGTPHGEQPWTGEKIVVPPSWTKKSRVP